MLKVTIRDCSNIIVRGRGCVGGNEFLGQMKLFRSLQCDKNYPFTVSIILEDAPIIYVLACYIWEKLQPFFMPPPPYFLHSL